MNVEARRTCLLRGWDTRVRVVLCSTLSQGARLKAAERHDPLIGCCSAFSGDAPVDKVAATLAEGARAGEKYAVLCFAMQVVSSPHPEAGPKAID